MNAAMTIKGWCPSALRPMRSGDGLLVRVRAPTGGLAVRQVRALACAATRFGNGHIDLTGRANLQIRGVRDELWPDLIEALRNAHLLDAEDAEAAPVNILLPPLTGLDRTARLDASSLAGALERSLREAPAFAALPSKFGFAIDDGGAFAPDAIDADVSLAACSLPAGEVGVALTIAASEASACVPVPDAPAAALRLTRAFLALRQQSERRMRVLVERIGAARIFAQAGLSRASVPAPASKPFASRSLLGVTNVGGVPVVGVAAPFGAWTMEGFACLADALGESAGASLRLTPWRIVLLTGLSADMARQAVAIFAARGLIVGARDPRLAIAACTGAPGCASASVPTRSLAQDLSALVSQAAENQTAGNIILHVSGCAKGCAHPHATPLTLVGRAGLFDLVPDGKPGDAPLARALDMPATFAAVSDRFGT